MSNKDDCINRRDVIDAMKDMYRAAEKWLRDATDDMTKARAESCMASLVEIKLRTEKLPTVQPERDIPIKPNETTDTAWGIPHRQAVCPKCDYYLGHVVFLGDGKGKKVTYCETCGQAIDWEGWDLNEQSD